MVEIFISANLFPFKVWQGVGHKVKEHGALPDLLNEQLLLVLKSNC